ncbi:unnamed protein product, partial [Meganyctiphanes norvegica]
NDKPYQCSHCERCFAFSEHLIDHKRIHTGEKSYQCCHCDKWFSERGQIITDQNIHTGEKIYRCSHYEIPSHRLSLPMSNTGTMESKSVEGTDKKKVSRNREFYS